MKLYINTTVNYLFKKSWVTVLLSLVFPFLIIVTENGWILFISVLYFLPAANIHYKNERWVGNIASLLSLVVTVLLTFLLGISMAAFPEPSDVHKDYASLYENKDKIESITGISIPEFTMDSSKITHMGQFDFEFTTEAILRFKTLPSNKTFRYLDSLCALHTPATVDTAITGSPRREQVNTFWSKENNTYYFSVNGNTESKELHSKDAFFYLTIKKNSRIAEMKYGNY